MGALFIVNSSFELSDVEDNVRGYLLESFCEAFSEANNNGDIFVGTEDFFTAAYSFGTLCEHLIYADWDSVSKSPHLKGVTSTVHNLIYTTLMPLPSIIRILDSSNGFIENFNLTNYGYAGLKINKGPKPFIWSKETWEIWQRQWLIHHQNEIVWKEGMDDFLPNFKKSNKILKREFEKGIRLRLERDGKNVEQEKLINEIKAILLTHKDSVNVAFYEEVVKKQGDQLEAYVQEIGGEIMAVNFYAFDEQLSRNEQRASGSFRRIFKLLNKAGRLQYISLDHRHGMFEYHNETGEHLGEKRFDGTPNKPADVSHNLKTLK